MEDVYICSSYRTVIGKINGQFSKISAIKLGSDVLAACYKKINLEPENIDQVIIGQTFFSGQGQNPARQTALAAKLPPEVTAYTINMLSGSGLKAIFEGFNSIRAGKANIIYAGGQENMTMTNHSANIRLKSIIGNVVWKDTLLTDGVVDIFLNLEISSVANDLAKKYNVSKEIQDRFAVMSQNHAIKSIDNEYFTSEITLIPDYHEPFIDECPIRNGSLDSFNTSLALAEDSLITKRNSAQMADGAAGVLLVSATQLCAKNILPQVRVVGMVQVGCEPIDMGLAPIIAIKSLINKIKWSVEEVDLYEIDECYAVHAILCIDMLNINLGKVNVSGGSIALGNPLGTSGVRMLVTLIHNLKRLKKHKGIATIGVEGGMGLAIAIENIEKF